MANSKVRHWDISGGGGVEGADPISSVLGEIGADPIAAVRGAFEVAQPFIHAPVAWMHTSFPEAVPEAHLDPYEGFEEEGSLFEALGVIGRDIGGLGLGGFSPEAPWQEYELTPELMEDFLPIAIELALYPTAAKYLTETMGVMMKGAQEIYRMGYPFTSPIRATETLAEGFAGAERRVKDIDRMWKSMLQEDEMAMNLGIAKTHGTPRHPGAQPGGATRVRQYTQSIWDEVGRKDVIPPTARESARAQARSGMNRLRQRFNKEQEALLSELEAAGVDPVQQLMEDPFNSRLYVTPDKFNRLKDRVDEVVKAELPEKLVTEIHEKVIPTFTGDPRYAGASGLARRRSMASALNEGLEPGSKARITVEEIEQAAKDPNLREKMAKLMARRITRKPWYKNRDQGFADLSVLMRLGEMGFGAVTGAAIDEENRLRGAIAGAALALLLSTAFRLGRSRYGKYLMESESAAQKAEIAGKELLKDTKEIKIADIFKSQRGAVEIEQPAWVRAAKERILGETEKAGPTRYDLDGTEVRLRQKEGFTKQEARARKSRATVIGKTYGIAIRELGMSRDSYRAWVVDTFGKGLSEMTEGEIVDKVFPALTQMRAESVVGAAELARAQKAKQVEDLAMELYGAKAQDRINRAVRKVTGVHRNLKELDTQTLDTVLSALPKRFLAGRGMNAMFRNIVGVEDALNKMGKWGKHIARTIRKDRLHTEYLAGKWISELEQLTKGLPEEDLMQIVAALHPMKANGYKTVIPQNERLAEIAIKVRNTLNEVGGLRKDIGDPIRLADGTERPFELLQDYYPIHVAPEEWLNSIKIRRRVVDHLIASGQARGETHAEEIFQRFIQGIVRNKFGNLDFAREAWIEPERFNLVKDLSRYYYGAAKRISRHMFFGRTGKSELPEKVEKWLDLLGKDVNIDEARFARKAVKRQFKHDAIDDAMHDMLKRVRSFETVAHMGLASIMNASEPVHTAIWAGFGNFMKGVGSALRSTSAMDAREVVVRTGASIGSTLRDLIGESGGAGSLTAKFLRATGFTGIEKWNRRLSGHVGIHYVEDLIKKLSRNPNSSRLRKSFDELLLDADAILERGITEEELIKGAMEVANRTQKRTQAIDLPYFMSSPYGRILTMFKTFAYGAARMMVRDVVTHPARLARMLIAFPIVGELVGDVRSLATGQWRDTEGLSRLWENYMYVGTMGIAFDFFRSVQFGESSVKSFLMGPVGSDFASITDGLYSWLAEGKGRKIGKQAVRMLPPPATLLRGYLFPSEPKRKWDIG